MLKLFYPISFSLSFLLAAPASVPSFYNNSSNASTGSNAISINLTTEAELLHQEIGLEKFGLSLEAFSYAYKGYQYLKEKKRITNSCYLTICDFSQSSGEKRLYVIDLENRQLSFNTYVAHGRNSGTDFAKRFSNDPRSHQSSLGFYITRGTYRGNHGYALNLDGIEEGFNNNALRRRIVLHGSKYVGEKILQANRKTGRSFGCPAVSRNECTDIINTIKNASCFFIYNPQKKYLEKSKILNHD